MSLPTEQDSLGTRLNKRMIDRMIKIRTLVDRDSELGLSDWTSLVQAVVYAEAISKVDENLQTPLYLIMVKVYGFDRTMRAFKIWEEIEGII
jgi:hypothetical protein